MYSNLSMAGPLFIMIQMSVGYGKGNSVLNHFQQYFGYIVEVSFIGGGRRSTGENHGSAASHWQILSHDIVSSKPRYERDSNSQL